MSYMDQALILARQSLGQVHPNPPVGAVIVKDGKVISEGFTQMPGGSHAEIMALAKLSYRASGAVMYSSLEPCCHYGRTPPCTEAIIDAGVSEVNIGALDRNPKVFSKGKDQLEKAGIKVNVGQPSKDVDQLYEAYFKFITTGLPFITFKFASSLDGKIAASDGSTTWITSEEARNRVHVLRSESDAVMIGIGTLLTDDPRLTARDINGSLLGKQPIKIIVDSHCRTSTDVRAIASGGKTIIAAITSADNKRLKQKGVEVIVTTSVDGRVDLTSLITQLGIMGITSILFEGGGTLASSFFKLGLIDKVISFIAPRIIGGKNTPTPVDGHGLPALDATQELRDVSVERIGSDIMIAGYPH